MNPRVLLDTQILVRWLAQPRRLSREQERILSHAARRSEPVAISAITLLELALLVSTRVTGLKFNAGDLLRGLGEEPLLRILPLTADIAQEVPHLIAPLRDPADCVIVATARVHGLRLLTSDQRILESNLVSTVA